MLSFVTYQGKTKAFLTTRSSVNQLNKTSLCSMSCYIENFLIDFKYFGKQKKTLMSSFDKHDI